MTTPAHENSSGVSSIELFFDLFCADALTFGLAYLFVVVLHLGAFALKGEGAAPRAAAIDTIRH